jgi:hypothetical protein
MPIVVEIDEDKFLKLPPGEQNLMLYSVMSAFVNSCDKKHSDLDHRCDECEKRLGTLETEKTIAARTGGVAGLAFGAALGAFLALIALARRRG